VTGEKENEQSPTSHVRLPPLPRPIYDLVHPVPTVVFQLDTVLLSRGRSLSLVMLRFLLLSLMLFFLRLCSSSPSPVLSLVYHRTRTAHSSHSSSSIQNLNCSCAFLPRSLLRLVGGRFDALLLNSGSVREEALELLLMILLE